MLLLLSATALAADLQGLQGAWVHSGNAAELALRDKAVARAAEEFNPLIRGIAEPKLQDSAPRPSGYVITLDGQRIGISMGGQTPAVTVIGAPPSSYVPDGKDDPVRIQRTVEGDALVSVVFGESGNLYSSFERVNEKLVVSYKVTSDKLDNPVTYRLTFVARP